MTTASKLGAYGVVLGLALGAGAAVGAVAGPIDVDDSPVHTADDTMTAAAPDLPAAGLLVSQDGYTFEPEDRLADRGEFAFRISGPDGTAVRDFDQLHERELHLVVASRDLTQFAHLHPVRDDDGRWTVDLPDLPAGAHRAFADFRPSGGDQLTLGVDLTAPGDVETAAPLRPRDTDRVDGYDVSLARSTDSDEVTITVRRDGEVVTTQPYLGSAGHLVALRDGDLVYLHVHPLDDEPAGPARFAVEVPSAGTYALFFDFKVDDVVRTARFVVDTTDPAPPVSSGGGEHGGH